MKIKNILVASLLATGSLTLPACTDEEVGLSVGAIIGGLVGVAIADGGSSHDHDHHGHYGDYPDHRDHRGDYDRRGDYGRGDDHYGRGRGGCNHNGYGCYNLYLDLDLDLDSQNQIQAVAATEKVAARYQISTEAAQTILTALKKAQEKDFSDLRELGFDRENFEAIYQNENPSVETLRTLSAKLGMDLGSTNDMIQKMKADVQAARAKQPLN